MTIAITGATGHLGGLVVDALLDQGLSADDLVAVVRTPSKAARLAERGVEVREASYTDSGALEKALYGVDKLLLVSGSEIGQRAAQHANVIARAKAAGVGFIAYTSVLDALNSPIALAHGSPRFFVAKDRGGVEHWRGVPPAGPGPRSAAAPRGIGGGATPGRVAPRRGGGLARAPRTGRMSRVMRQPNKPGLLTLTIKDKSALYLAYMPFVKNGGLFIPTSSNYRLGDEVFMLLNLMGEDEKLPVAGRVIWMTPKGAQGKRTAGIGVQFSEQDRGNTQRKIESYLAGALGGDKPTHTM